MRVIALVAVSVLCLGADKDTFSPAQRKYWAFQPSRIPKRLR